jgi:hypothetical protein
MWAVADIVSEQLKARITKARQMPLGASGLFYCSDAECFTVPFHIQSHPEFRDVPGVWHFPFRIEPLGDLSKRIPLANAKATWRTLEGTSNVTKRINISGGMAFVPLQRRLGRDFREAYDSTGSLTDPHPFASPLSKLRLTAYSIMALLGESLVEECELSQRRRNLGKRKPTT